MKSILLVFFILTIIAFVKQLKYPERELFSFDKDRCNSLRGVMSLMIVCCHTSYSSSDMRGWGAPVVTMFMFMSGYGLMNSFVRAGFKYLEGYFHNRVGKILLPLLLVTTIHMLVFFDNNTISYSIK